MIFAWTFCFLKITVYFIRESPHFFYYSLWRCAGCSCLTPFLLYLETDFCWYFLCFSKLLFSNFEWKTPYFAAWEVETRIYIGSMLFIIYNVYLVIYIFYKAVYFIGRWNPNLYRFCVVYLIKWEFIHIIIIIFTADKRIYKTVYIWWVFIHVIIIFTADKCIYKTVYIRGGWNQNLYRFSVVYLI